jgi:hypothetical protein
MLVQDPVLVHEAEVARALERQIVQCTWGRLHRLRIEKVLDRIVVQGWTSSYYVKQLAVLAVHEVLDGAALSVDCEVDIEVGAGDPRAPQPAPLVGSGRSG